MALTYSEANSVQSNYFDKTISQAVYEDSPFLYKLKKSGQMSVGGGNQIQWPIRYREHAQAKEVTADQQIPYVSKDTRTAAVLDWKYIVGNSVITWDERIKNGDKAQIVNLLKDKQSELDEDVAELFADQLFATTQASGALSGLETIVDSSTSYGGIAVEDASVWAATEDSSTTELVLFGTGSLSYMINQATFGKKGPSLHVTTRDLFSKFESLLEPQKRYEDKSMADGGFTSLTFHSKPVVSDVHCGSGRWYGLCMEDLELIHHKDHNFKTSEWFKLEQVGYPYHLARHCTWAGNLLARQRRTHFKFTALNYAL